MNSQIYIVKNYKIKRDILNNIVKGSSDIIIKALTENKGYHQLLMDDINYNLFFDIDGISKTDDHLIYEFMNQ